MSLLDDITAERRTGGTRCNVGHALREMSDADRGDLIEAIGNERYPAAAISRALAKRTPPVELRDQSITRHRRGECHCEPA